MPANKTHKDCRSYVPRTETSGKCIRNMKEVEPNGPACGMIWEKNKDEKVVNKPQF